MRRKDGGCGMSLIKEKTLAEHGVNVRSIRQELQLLEEQLKKHGRNEIQPSLTAADLNTVSRQAEPQWIPCSERLPKEEDYRECMECLDGAVWYYTNRKTMGLGYYYDSTKQWSTICDMKPDGKVIAWMPLPGPYLEDD